MLTANRLALGLLLIGCIGGGITLFAPAERWGVVDVGATGGAVFVLSLVAAVALFAARGDQIFPERMSVAERRAWVGLVFLALILATFAREMLALAGHAVVPESTNDLFAPRYLQRYVLLSLAWGLLAHLVGRGGGIETDERDLQMRHRADRAGDWALTLIVISGIFVLATYPRAVLAWWLAPIVLANVFIGLLIAKSLVEHLVLAYQYRRA